MELKFTVRKQDGTVLKKDNDVIKITWHGPNANYCYEAIKALPAYTRGKLKADLMCRNIPRKELSYYDNEGLELVMSESHYDSMMKAYSYKSYHYEDGTTSECYPVGLSFLYLKFKTYHFNAAALYNMVERQMFQDCRKPYSFGQIDQLVGMGEWLKGLSKAKTIKTRIEGDYSKYLYVSYDDIGEERIGQLSYDQAKVFKTETYQLSRSACQILESEERNKIKAFKGVENEQF